jgi:hypothetical protein
MTLLFWICPSHFGRSDMQVRQVFNYCNAHESLKMAGCEIHIWLFEIFNLGDALLNWFLHSITFFATTIGTLMRPFRCLRLPLHWISHTMILPRPTWACCSVRVRPCTKCINLWNPLFDFTFLHIHLSIFFFFFFWNPESRNQHAESLWPFPHPFVNDYLLQRDLYCQGRVIINEDAC